MSKAAGSVEKRSGFSEFALDVRSGWYSRISPYKDEYKAVMGAAPAGRSSARNIPVTFPHRSSRAVGIP